MGMVAAFREGFFRVDTVLFRNGLAAKGSERGCAVRYWRLAGKLGIK
jgi:hypothetical protein